MIQTQGPLITRTVNAPFPADEVQRLQRLRELFVLDTAPEPLFDGIARMASEVFGAPIALLSLVDAQRQWFKANIGMPGVTQTAREVAFCAHAILGDAPLIVTDATADPRFADSALVTGAPDIRFYAGAPLVMADGTRLGALCVMDRQPRSLSPDQTRQLQDLARLACDGLVMRRDLIARALSARSHLESALARSEQQYRRIVEDQSELVSLARPDGVLTYVNPAYARHYSSTPEQVIGRSLFEFVAADDLDAVRGQISQVLATGGARTSTNRTALADGSQRWVSWTNALQLDGDGVPLLHSVGRDITPQTLARQQLARQTATLRAVAEAQPALIAVLGADGCYREVNASFERWSGRTRDRIIGCSMEDVLDADDFEFSMPWIQRVLGGESVQFERTFQTRRGVRHLAVSYEPLLLEDGQVDGFIAIGNDITVHKREQRRLQDLSQRDALTGLLNRGGLEQFLQEQRDRNALQMLAFLYIDLDHFKPVNDAHGHAVGDQVLQAFAKRLEGLVRPSDAVARVGGDEFVVALAGMQAAGHAQAVADKVVLMAKQPFGVDELTLQISASVGVAFDDDPDSRWQGLLASADAQLFEAKRAGRGRLAADDADADAGIVDQGASGAIDSA